METKELELKLSELKTSLEESLTKKAKDEITAQIKAVSDQIEALKVSMPKPDTESATKIKSLEDQLKAVKDAADANQPVIDAFVASTKDAKIPGQVKSFEQNLKDTLLEKSDDIAKFARKETKGLVVDLKTVGDITTSNVTGGTRYGEQFAPGIIQQPTRRLHIRNLPGLSTATAGPGNTFTFMKENGAGEGGIAPTAETGTKPQLDFDLVEATVNFETIAGWVRVTRKAMNNIPGFVSFLTSRLPEKLLRVEDNQILYGDDATPNLDGIGNTGNFTAATTTATEMEEALIDAISQLEDTNERYATGILVRPKAYYNFFKSKASGSGEYDLPKNFIFVNGVLYVSGVPVYPSTAVTVGDYFVGDWAMGTQLLIQESMRIEFFEQDSTNVRENKVTVRIEETIALPVYGSDFFIKGNDVDQS